MAFKQGVELTRENTTANGDISSEGAFLVNVSAFNSLVKRKGNTSTLHSCIIVNLLNTDCISIAIRQCRQNPAVRKTIVKKTSFAD